MRLPGRWAPPPSPALPEGVDKALEGLPSAHPEQELSMHGRGQRDDPALSGTRPRGDDLGDACDANPLPSVPWGWGTTASVLGLWLAGFYALAYVGLPACLAALGLDPGNPDPTFQALRHLLLDAAQLSYTLALLRGALGPSRPRAKGLFRFSLRPVMPWLVPVVSGAALFPLVHAVHKLVVVALSTPVGPMAGGGEVAAQAMLSSGGAATRALWLAMLALCAPLWEELVFRGFLLPSLGARLSPRLAVLASALLFACVHFSTENFLPLVLLGWIFGAAYRHSGANLVPCVALHSLWNVYLLVTVCGF